LDETQRHLAQEMLLDGRRYAFKSGDSDPKDSEGCTIEEATIALACAAGDISLAVVAKRHISGLWKDITKPPYTTIFNERTKARDLWRAVIILRAAESAMEKLDHTRVERGDQILVHGNRLLTYAVFQDPTVRRYKDPLLAESELNRAAVEATERLFIEIGKAVKEKHPGAYLQPLFKNVQKSKELLADDDDKAQVEMFPRDDSHAAQ
jgi:hypothetical protein